MRTKLDEIVEEVLAMGEGLSPERRENGNRIAERAFRHGVERAREATNVISGHEFDCNGAGLLNIMEMAVNAARHQMANAQPAPAEEKHRCVIGGHCVTCDGDRRKGERRKGLEKKGTVDFYVGPGSFGIFQLAHGTAGWVQDRRSGHDRRSSPSTDKDRRK
jgi:hypothetical protein